MKKQMAKLESRIKELEGELETEQTAKNELVKTQRKNERKLKELQLSNEEDQKSITNLQDQVNKSNAKAKKLQRELTEMVRLFKYVFLSSCLCRKRRRQAH